MINLFEPDPRKETIYFLKKIFKKKYFYKNDYFREFLNLFSNFQDIDKKKIIFGASCSDLIFNIMFSVRNIIKRKLVIVPSNSFPAVPSSVIRAGLKLKIVDIDYETGNISFDALKKVNKNNIGCIFVTHYGGNPVNIHKLKTYLNKDCLIFEDCAGALGTFHEDGKAVGTKGDFACWSFDPMKMITCGEGGAAYIKNKKILKTFSENLYLGLSNKQQSGFSNASKRSQWWKYQIKSYGTRSVFTEIDAAIGVPQIKKIKNILKKRKKLRNIYCNRLKKQKNITILKNINGKEYSNYFFTIYANNRDKLAEYLFKKNVYSSLRYYPLNKIKLFKKYCNLKEFINSNYFEKKALNLPMHQNLSLRDIEKITKLIHKYYK